MDKYDEAELRLFFLLKKRDGDTAPGTHNVPRWCRDDAAAFRLMVEHGLYPTNPESTAMYVYIAVQPADHPDKETAVRYAIVQAVIKKLEADHG